MSLTLATKKLLKKYCLLRRAQNCGVLKLQRLESYLYDTHVVNYRADQFHEQQRDQNLDEQFH